MTNKTIQIPTQFQFLFKPKRYKIMYSGRMAAKSWSVAQALLIMGAQKSLRILCAREFQNSITDSVHKLLSDMNERYDMGYEVTNNSIRHPITGTEIMFYGLKSNITKIKSLEGIDICWVEESETISQASLDVLLPTIRKQDSEFWATFNPSQPSDAVYKMFVTPNLLTLGEEGVYADQSHYILRTSYKDNPFLSTTAKDDIFKMQRDNYERYLHVFGGYPQEDSELSIIKPIWFDAAIDAHIKLKFEPMGAKVVGFDPADEGKDAKAYCFRHGSVVLEVDQWETGDLESACVKVWDMAAKNSASDIVYDVCGLGVGAKVKFNALDPAGRIIVTPFNGASRADNPKDKYKEDQINQDVFKNKRAQYYTELANRFENTYIAVTRGTYMDPEKMISISSTCDHLEELKQELTNIRRKAGTGNTFIQIESKAEMKKRGMKSPNLADSFTYVIANPTILTTQFEEINFVSAW